jgi:hypothetical protein
MHKAVRVQDERFFSKSLAELNFSFQQKQTQQHQHRHEAGLSDASDETEHLLPS